MAVFCLTPGSGNGRFLLSVRAIWLPDWSSPCFLRLGGESAAVNFRQLLVLSNAPETKTIGSLPFLL